jgi:hypothetical protein
LPLVTLTNAYYSNAHFTPSYALSFYLQGKPGAGKSSLVRNFCPALNATVEEHADPEILVRFVKQNLNKPFEDLQLELELRPNNNDLSVMSIIQGRRMTMTQSKPGLVVVDLEEMASNDPDANPNQLKTAQLISQRFSGRNGDYKADAKAPRNSEKRGTCVCAINEHGRMNRYQSHNNTPGISGDATLITLFTSNYELEKECKDALLRLKMFENLKCMVVTAVSGDDRSDFAHAYIQQCVQDRFANLAPECSIELNISMGEGDTRLLVRHLRLLAFYLCSLVADSVSVKSRIVAKIAQTSSGTYIVSWGDRSIELKTSSLQNLLPVEYRVFDSRTEIVVDGLRESFKGDESNILNRLDEISQILDFYFAKALAPVVVVSNNAELIEKLVALVGVQKDVQMIPNVDPKSYKMMKSLYDPSDTPNLRDDILKFGRGAFVAVELECHSKDAQLCIREIIEDSPSMTAFSTSKSALYKHGLFFGVYVDGEITPEVLSRASLII